MEPTYNVSVVLAGSGQPAFHSVNRPMSDVDKLSMAVSYGSAVVNWWQPEIKDCNGNITQHGGYSINIGKDKVTTYSVRNYVAPAPCPPPNTGGATAPTQPVPTVPGYVAP